MQLRCLTVLLLGSLALGQAAAPAPAAPPQKPAASPAAGTAAPVLAPDVPVVTIAGLCSPATPPKASANKSECKTVLTRAQFEKIAYALEPGMSLPRQRQLATTYATLLVSAQAAQKRDLEKGPRFEQLMEFARVQVLSQQLSQVLRDESKKISDQEIEQYYRNHQERFERAELLRLFVPKARPAATDKPGEEKDKKMAEPDPDAMKKLADAMRARAVAGEDFEKLQKEVYADSGLKTPVPFTTIGKTIRANLPVSQRSVVDLKPGEVSPVFDEAAGYYIYKLISKESPPLEQVRAEILSGLQNQKLADSMQAVGDAASTELNEAYFGPAPAPPAPAGPSRVPKLAPKAPPAPPQ